MGSGGQGPFYLDVNQALVTVFAQDRFPQTNIFLSLLLEDHSKEKKSAFQHVMQQKRRWIFQSYVGSVPERIWFLRRRKYCETKLLMFLLFDDKWCNDLSNVTIMRTGLTSTFPPSFCWRTSSFTRSCIYGNLNTYTLMIWIFSFLLCLAHSLW